MCLYPLINCSKLYNMSNKKFKKKMHFIYWAYPINTTIVYTNTTTFNVNG